MRHSLNVMIMTALVGFAVPGWAVEYGSSLDVMTRVGQSSYQYLDEERNNPPISVLGSIQASRFGYLDRVVFNFEADVKDVGYTNDANQFVLNEAYVKSKYFFGDRVTFYLGRMLSSEGFSLNLMDGGKVEYHIIPSVLYTIYGGSIVYDKGTKRNARYTAVKGTRLQYYNDSDFLLSLGGLQKKYKDDGSSHNFVNSSMEKIFFVDSPSNIRTYYNAEINTKSTIADAAFGSDFTYDRNTVLGLLYGRSVSIYDYYERSEVIRDLFVDGQINRIRGSVATNLPLDIKLGFGYTNIEQEQAKDEKTSVTDMDIEKKFSSILIDKIKLSASKMLGSEVKLNSVGAKIKKEIFANKLAVDLSYDQDEFKKMNGIKGTARFTELGGRYAITGNLDTRIAVSHERNTRFKSLTSGLLYLSYYNF